jgi:multidrug efflux pump subunit AcrA (membrane-fusion protein)
LKHFVVPASSSDAGRNNIRYVFVESQEVKHVEVLIGKRFDDMLEIISDNLKEGDRLVTEGQSRLLNDDKIEIAN